MEIKTASSKIDARKQAEEIIRNLSIKSVGLVPPVGFLPLIIQKTSMYIQNYNPVKNLVKDIAELYGVRNYSFEKVFEFARGSLVISSTMLTIPGFVSPEPIIYFGRGVIQYFHEISELPEVTSPHSDAIIPLEGDISAIQIRYHSLVEKKYLQGLSDSENQEMENLGELLDDEDAPFYEEILSDLRK